VSTNRLIPCFLFTFLLLTGFVSLLHSQNNETGNSSFFQRLRWTGGEYALRYEVIVQREINGTYITHLRESTETSFIVVSLPPGDYRFQVTSYDVLDRPEHVSRWMNFKVLPAAQNEIIDIASELDANDGDDASSTENISESESKKSMLMFAGAAWAPVFPIHGSFFGESVSPAGAGAHFAAVFPIPRGLYAGAELSAFWHINADNNENILPLGVNLLVMKWLSIQTMALNFRLGLSFVLLPDTQEKLMFNIGASYLWRFTDKFLLEAGLEYAGLLKENYFDGCIRPWLGVSMIFSPFK